MIDMTEQEMTKKVTPYKDVTWYVKWISCALILTATSFRAAGPTLYIYDIIFSILGMFGWIYVGFKWNDRAILLLNGCLCAILLGAFFRYMFT
tara:strand:- start:7009 stop:7287 length:279 start_codon:yes stop_codon:yes gene_type:complete